MSNLFLILKFVELKYSRLTNKGEKKIFLITVYNLIVYVAIFLSKQIKFRGNRGQMLTDLCAKFVQHSKKSATTMWCGTWLPAAAEYRPTWLQGWWWWPSSLPHWKQETAEIGEGHTGATSSCLYLRRDNKQKWRQTIRSLLKTGLKTDIQLQFELLHHSE